MKTRAAVLVALTLSAHPAAAFNNEPPGFRGIEWDTPFEKVQDEMVPVGSEGKGGSLFYQRKDDKLSIGGADLTEISYVFYKGHFLGVLARTAEGVGNQRALKDAMFAQFGAGAQPNRYMEQYLWFGTSALISLDCFGAQRRCSLYMRSRAVGDRERSDKKSTADDAKKDF